MMKLREYETRSVRDLLKLLKKYQRVVAVERRALVVGQAGVDEERRQRLHLDARH